jgi:hypothetical protein
MRTTIRATLLFIAAALMGLAATVNAVIAVPHLRDDMAEINVRPTLLGAVSLGLYFGTFAMFGFTFIVLVAAIEASRGGRQAKPFLAIIAVVYAAFGGASFFAWKASAHTLGYLVIGVIIGLAITLRGSPDESVKDAVLR